MGNTSPTLALHYLTIPVIHRQENAAMSNNVSPENMPLGYKFFPSPQRFIKT